VLDQGTIREIGRHEDLGRRWRGFISACTICNFIEFDAMVDQ